MKRFHFALQTALRWRNERAQAEEMKLDRLLAERQAHEKALTALLDRRARAERSVLDAPFVEAADLCALDAFRLQSNAESVRIRARASGCDARIAAQRSALVEARRQARLLENLRQKRRQEWTRSFDAELEQNAGELFLAAQVRARD